MASELDELRDGLRLLGDRVDALEAAATTSRPAAPAGPAVHRDDDAFWALNGLTVRLPDHPATVDGAVLLVGQLTLPTGEPVSWQQATGTAGLLDSDWGDRAAAFAALGHPVRLELLRHVLSGTRATARLSEMDSLGTTGQLHHHLRQLLAAGWLHQTGRGSYDVPPARVVPLLACLSGAAR
ncbi:ArsR/SmtB family transcription factor [Nocardioides daejeonensis]|uniref:ArsR/SmtB family transcription factor n=1 Tax=Nocardioides daejeonensis TaxID=1046556 RepID=UPI000D743985|nr:helix-turn-helix domain-containing protein [Nocardioides daejeonensis]